ncbi:MAG: tRNA uridine-5-carboxymethylaminomethyl(34) synthesis GTPase MnmE [Hyphomicrobiaceae bacterium]
MSTAPTSAHTAQDTIFALSSGSGRVALAVVRVSGPAAGIALDRLAAPRPKPRFAALRKLRHPDTGEVIDHALVLWFPGPRSETGEDMCELHLHGGRAVLAAAFAALSAIPGCRPATAGEFARRAFENGRLDLTAAEGIIDLIDADTEAQRRQALRQASGALADLYEGWRTELIEAQALLEAAIDFSDEGDIAETTEASGIVIARDLARRIRSHLEDGRRGEIVREGFRIVIAGPPNVGKSSLMNALARRDVAIVSDEPGTTRDVLEVRLDLDGYMAIVADTAGLREAAGAIEQEGIRRALSRAGEADLILWIIDATKPAADLPSDLARGKPRVLRILNKIDMAKAGLALPIDHAISALTGAGVPELVAKLAGIVRKAAEGSEAPAITQLRHRRQIEACLEALDAVGPSTSLGAEIAAEQLRIAADALGRIMGRIDPEDVLDQVFARFCIGK